jgi:hypothetical protein
MYKIFPEPRRVEREDDDEDAFVVALETAACS